METGFVNSRDGDHLSVLSHFYDQGMLEDSETLLDIMQEEFSFTSLSSSHLIGSPSLWDQDTNDGADTELAVPFPVDDSHSDVLKEDFQKMLSDWQEHLGTLQASDSEDMDVKDLVELDIDMPKNVPVDIPSDIFENPQCELRTELSVGKASCSSKDRIFSELSLNLSENLSTFNLENFLEDDDEEEHKFGLIVAEEEELADKISVGSIEKGQEIAATNSGVNSSNVNQTEKITTKTDVEEEAVDVETVLDQIPVLEAGDVHSLLEQFEASEAVNRDGPSPVKSIKAVASELIFPSKKQVLQKGSVIPTPSSITTSTTSANPSVEANRVTLHETIRDSLPQEVIDRIKASNRRKPISVIPAMPSRRPGRGATRMQVAAATLSRNKLLKLVSGGGKSGESIQLDHDYCSSASSPPAEVAPPKSFYHSNASEYTSEQSQSSPGSSKDSEDSTCAKSVLGDNKVYSRLPEYYVVLAPQKALEKGRKGAIKEEVWDKNSRKDSGLESGEVSDASEETIGTPVTIGSREMVQNSSPSLVKSDDRKCIKNVVPSSTEKGVVTVDVQNKVDLTDRRKQGGLLRAEGSQCVLKDWSTLRQDSGMSKPVAMVSVLKKNNVGCITNVAGRQQSLLISSNCNNASNSSSSTSSSSGSSTSCKNTVETANNKSEGPKKRKLNLEEYRSRLKELDRTKIKEEPSKKSPVSNLLSASNPITTKTEGDPPEAKKEDINKEVSSRISGSAAEEDKTQRPVMHSVEVQTQTSIFDEVQDNAGKTQERRSRKKQRKYCSTRASSSSSSHSTSSSGSRRHRRSRSQIRRRTSRRRSHGGHSVSSSGSQRPRSRSNSSRSSSSYSSYSSRSRSRSRSRSSLRRSPSSCRPRSSYSYQHRYGPRRPLPYSTGWRSRSRSPPFTNRKNDWMLSEREKQRQVEERRVIYVGRIDEGTSKAELRRRFEPFGPIIDISVHFREHGDNYGFVTFAYKVDAYEAVEHGNDDPNLPRYDLCFGGRRAFCKTRYADLDGLATSDGSMPSSGYMRSSGYSRRTEPPAEDFDLLLREAQAKLRKRKV
ncbi:hypothetical protein R5R35_013522 [Gryllus longicercus]|uniref:RRM domain-containing protein n=1 Tax=Gryllus longicercus TaxID=2509291 RepID=A0AAN9V9Q2_9ORTH